MKYIIANLKAHQNLGEAITWSNKFVNIVRNDLEIKQSLRSGRLKVILAPSTPFLVPFKSVIHEFQNVELAAQDVSQITAGSYTGEVGAHALAGLVQYAIVGHSERRKYNHETHNMVREKMENAQRANITPIVCMGVLGELLNVGHGMVAYEPPDAIGSGKNYPVESVVAFREKIALPPHTPFLYGGSADETNQHEYLKTDGIDGLLVGTAALDVSRFCEMLRSV